MDKMVILFLYERCYKQIMRKISAVLKTSLNIFAFLKLKKSSTVQEWSINKLKHHIDNCSAEVQRTVGPFSLQDTEQT